MNKSKRSKNTSQVCYFYRRPMLLNQTKTKPQSSPQTPKAPPTITKRVVVKNAYYALREVLKEFNISCVKKTFGPGIVRVHCRSVIQLDTIALVVKKLLQSSLIEEIGMPLDYQYKFMTLVLFIKPVDDKSTMHITDVFHYCMCEYDHTKTNVEYPTTAAMQTFKEEPNPITSIHLSKVAPGDKDTKRTPMKAFCSKLIAVFIHLFILCLILFLTSLLPEESRI